MANPFISTTDLSDYLGRNVTGDAGGTIAVDAACEVVRTVAGQTFNEVVGGTAILDGTGTDTLILPELPVNAAGTVIVNGEEVTDYALRDDGVLIRQAGVSPAVWSRGRQNIEVTYDHGYTEVPADVRMVALAYATRLVVQGAASFEAVGPTQIRYAVANTDLTNGEKLILSKYRQRS